MTNIECVNRVIHTSLFSDLLLLRVSTVVNPPIAMRTANTIKCCLDQYFWVKHSLPQLIVLLKIILNVTEDCLYGHEIWAVWRDE